MPRDYKRDVGGWRDSPAYKEAECDHCHKPFKQKSWNHKFCSTGCKGKHKYTSLVVSTDTQYASISGDWGRYMSRLLYFNGRKRDELTREVLLQKLEDQEYRCALTGVELTCLLEKGKRFKTNASVDRIIPGGSYSKDNIQLVCQAVNYWRSDTNLEEFVEWCRKVVEKADA